MAASNKIFVSKRVLVTGGGRGIGLDIVKRFYNEGATVIVLDKEQSLLEKMKQEMPNLITACVDLRNWEQTQEIVTKFTPLDHLINNAGVCKCENLLDVTPQSFDLTFAVNLRALVAVTQAFVKGNKETNHPGTVVNISSLSDRCAFHGGAIYASSKAGVTRLTQAMGLEFAKYKIRVNCVCPSFIVTDMTTGIEPEFHALNAPTVERIPMKEPLTTDDVVEAVIFLSSPSSKMITGTSLLVDGGCKAAS